MPAALPPVLPLALFALTYLGLALGRIRGLALDRTGFALLGAVSFLATGIVSLEDAKQALDAGTLAVLFGMMMLSAQYHESGLYAAIGRRLTRTARPRRLLLGALLVSAALSALLTNDVVCFALAPLVGGAVLRARRDPLPYLLAIACGANLGSALTPIGNPQNILIAQRLHLAFVPFVAACAGPVLVGLVFAYFRLARAVPDGRDAAGGAAEEAPALDRRGAAKAVALTAAAVALFLTPIPAGVTALAIAGVVLTSRKLHTRDALGLVDWHTLALFVGLFVVHRGLESSGWADAAARALAAHGADLARPWILAPAIAVLGNVVGNVPAVMLVLPFVPATPPAGWTLALVSTLSGNALLIGSIANLIVAEQADRLGVPFGFREHLGIGLPVTAVSLAAAAVAMALWR